MKTNVISLHDRFELKARDVLVHTIATKLNISKNSIYPEHLKVTSALMADVADGYILYSYNSTIRAALIINTIIAGNVFPFIYHSDSEGAEPLGLLYADMSFEHIGSFSDYISADDNLHYYHSFSSYIPKDLNGMGFIQAIYNAKLNNVNYFDNFNIRRIAKLTKQELM